MFNNVFMLYTGLSNIWILDLKCATLDSGHYCNEMRESNEREREWWCEEREREREWFGFTWKEKTQFLSTKRQEKKGNTIIKLGWPTESGKHLLPKQCDSVPSVQTYRAQWVKHIKSWLKLFRNLTVTILLIQVMFWRISGKLWKNLKRVDKMLPMNCYLLDILHEEMKKFRNNSIIKKNLFTGNNAGCWMWLL